MGESGQSGRERIPGKTDDYAGQYKPVRDAAITHVVTGGHKGQDREKDLGGTGQYGLCQHRLQNEYSVNLTNASIKIRPVNFS